MRHNARTISTYLRYRVVGDAVASLGVWYIDSIIGMGKAGVGDVEPIHCHVIGVEDESIYIYNVSGINGEGNSTRRSPRFGDVGRLAIGSCVDCTGIAGRRDIGARLDRSEVSASIRFYIVICGVG